MDKSSKIFFVVFFAIIFVVIGIAFYRYFVLKDYYIQTEIDCDPEQESCFVYTCEPTDDPECPEVEADRISYYKLIEKKASVVPLCDPNDLICPKLSCEEGEDCQVINCDPEAGDECSS